MTAPGEPTFFPSASAKCLRGHMEPVTSEELHPKSKSLGADTAVGPTQRGLLGEVWSQGLLGTRVQSPDTAVAGGKLAISVASGMRLLCVGKNKNKRSFLQTSCKAEETCRRRGSDFEAASVGPPGKAGLSSLIPTRVGRKGARREERQGRPCSFTQCSQSEHQRQVMKVSGLGGRAADGQAFGSVNTVWAEGRALDTDSAWSSPSPSSCSLESPPSRRCLPRVGLGLGLWNPWASPIAQLVKNLPAMQETPVGSLG